MSKAKTSSVKKPMKPMKSSKTSKPKSAKPVEPVVEVQAAPPEPAPKPVFPSVFAPCKRGKDPATNGQFCNGRRANRISEMGAQSVHFKCETCGYSWHVPVGGAINY